MNKKIRNVVFYSFHGERGKMHQACIFYTDGTVENVSHEEGLEAAYIIADEENIKTREDFLNSLNKKRIYSITGKELEKRFKEFMQTSVVPVDTGRKSITKTKTNKSETNTSSSNKGKKKKKGLWAK